MADPDVVLRPWRASDVLAIAMMAADSHIRRWSSMGNDIPGWIAREQTESRGPSRAICLNTDDTALGKVALRLPGHASPATTCAAIRPQDAPVGELSYWLVPHARGRGIALAAVKHMLALAAGTTDLRTVVLDIEPANIASIRLAERLGAERRAPERIELDRTGTRARFVVCVATLSRRLDEISTAPG